jgi:hypothetical protein
MNEHERKIQEQALRNARVLLDRLERDDPARAGERKLMLVVGMLVLALVATVGIAMMLQAPKEKDLARHRCEMEAQVASVWKATEALKQSSPGMNAGEMQNRVEARRGEFKDAAKVACAAK